MSIAVEPPVVAGGLLRLAPVDIEPLPSAHDVPPPWLKLPAAPPISTCAPQALNMPATMPAANLPSMANHTSFALTTLERTLVRLRQ
jgi:hypothetical protein